MDTVPRSTVADTLIEDLTDELVAARDCTHNLAEDLAAYKELLSLALAAVADVTATLQRANEANAALRGELRRYTATTVRHGLLAAVTHVARDNGDAA